MAHAQQSGTSGDLAYVPLLERSQGALSTGSSTDDSAVHISDRAKSNTTDDSSFVQQQQKNNKYRDAEIKNAQGTFSGGLSDDLSGGNKGVDLKFDLKQGPKTDQTSFILLGNAECNGGLDKDFKFNMKVGVARDKNNKSIGIVLMGNHVALEDAEFSSFSPQLFLGAATNIGQNGSSLSCSATLSPVDIGVGFVGSLVSTYAEDVQYQAGICYSAGIDIDAAIATPNDKGEIQVEGYCNYYKRNYSYKTFQGTPATTNKLGYINTGITIRYKMLGWFGVFTNIEYTGFCYDASVETYKRNSSYIKAGIFMQPLNE